MKILNKRIITITFIIFSCIFIGCSSPKQKLQNKNNSKPTIAVSIIPEKTFVKAVGGDLINVFSIIPEGQSPENFEPTPETLQNFSTANIYFTMNLPSEASSILPKTKDLNKDVKIINLSDEVKKTYKDREFSPGNRDPHIWLSPKRVKIMINIIRDELSSMDPKNKEIYFKNANNYIQKLDKLDKDIKNSLKNIKNRTIIVYHPSFGYFADDYNLKMIALEKEGKEATPQSIEELIDYAKKNNIKCVFYQAEIDSKQAETFATEIKGKSVKLCPLASNYIENLKLIATTFKSTSK